jgi:hypothetical protein
VLCDLLFKMAVSYLSAQNTLFTSVTNFVSISLVGRAQVLDPIQHPS